VTAKTGDDEVILRVFENKISLSRTAAEQTATAVRRAILDRGRARIVVATGTSQLDFLDALTKAENIDWQLVEMFHHDVRDPRVGSVRQRSMHFPLADSP
jgi:6-phosphogluconolactonase/glucosamine-6-phosphate isomerase/deaminase